MLGPALAKPLAIGYPHGVSSSIVQYTSYWYLGVLIGHHHRGPSGRQQHDKDEISSPGHEGLNSAQGRC